MQILGKKIVLKGDFFVVFCKMGCWRGVVVVCMSRFLCKFALCGMLRCFADVSLFLSVSNRGRLVLV